MGCFQPVLLRGGCCGACSLRTCVLGIAYFSLAMITFVFVSFLGLLATRSPCLPHSATLSDGCILLQYGNVICLGCLLSVSVVALLLVGIYRAKPWFMVPYIVWGFFGIGYQGYLVMEFATMSSIKRYSSQNEPLLQIMGALILYGFSIYIHLHVISLFRVLREELKLLAAEDLGPAQELRALRLQAAPPDYNSAVRNF